MENDKTAQNLLEIKGLKTCFNDSHGMLRAVDGVDFSIKYGETLGVVGESGCGKSVLSLSILQLLSSEGKITEGEILFKGENLLKKSQKEMEMIRGNDISMIFQEPMTSLNPVYTVGAQISENLRLHQNLNKKQAYEKSIEMLRLVGIPSPEKRVNEYPHEMSGGMRQRVMIAMALSCNPSLLIADEPTTALDVTIQAQILELMREIKQRLGTSIMMITHDLGIVAEMSDHIMVMYAGKVMEYADVRSIFKDPRHPYTQGLLRSIPRIDDYKKELYVIKGMVPNIYNLPDGCRFCPRCPDAMEICHHKEPGLINLCHHKVRCWKYANKPESGE